MYTIVKLIRLTTGYFQGKGIASARLDAELLLAHVLGIRRINLYLNHDRPVQPKELERFRCLVRRRAMKEPIAYITGAKEFWSLEFALNPSVLIPRPETECLVEQALKAAEVLHRESGQLVRACELGTGSGAVAVALAHSLSHILRVTATDISPEALAVARANAIRNGVDARVRFMCGDLFDFINPAVRFHLIVSNPPYIPSSCIPSLMPEVRDYEPIRALDGGDNGLAIIRKIIREAPCRLEPGGHLLLECGHEQREAISEMLKETESFEEPLFYRDYSGHNRVVSAMLRKGSAHV